MVARVGQSCIDAMNHYCHAAAIYVESFNGHFRDECLNEHWFASFDHARAFIDARREEYKDERPKNRSAA